MKTCEKRVLLEEPALLPVNVEGLTNLSGIPTEIEIMINGGMYNYISVTSAHKYCFVLFG